MRFAVDGRHGVLQAMEVCLGIETSIKHVDIELITSLVCSQGAGQQAHAVCKKHAGGGLLQARAVDGKTGLNAHARSQRAPRHVRPTA